VCARWRDRSSQREATRCDRVDVRKGIRARSRFDRPARALLKAPHANTRLTVGGFVDASANVNHFGTMTRATAPTA
jgi:hypothetical protein